MHVFVYVPDGETESGGRALLVFLHGCGMVGGDLQQFGALEAVAEEHGAVVLLPDVPDGGVLLGCWDYYGPDHTRDQGHQAEVLNTVDWVLAEPFDIDPNQVGVAGLSSGGGMSMLLGCLAPDVFAGVGVVAGPTVGTTSLEIGFEATTPEEGTALCLDLAGDNADSFGSQFAITTTDAADFVVAVGYAAVNSIVFRRLYEQYGAAFDLINEDLELYGGAGAAIRADDGEHSRVLWWRSEGVGHRWPTGSGQPDTLTISGLGPNFADVFARTLTLDNPRIEDDEPDPGEDSGGETEETGESEGSTDETAEATTDTSDEAAADEDSGAMQTETGANPAQGSSDGCSCQVSEPRSPWGSLLIWSIPCLGIRRLGSRRCRPRSHTTRGTSRAGR